MPAMKNPNSFCYNKKMKLSGRAARRVLFFAWVLGLAAPGLMAQKLDDLMGRLQTEFGARNLTAFAENFLPSIREQEEAAASSFLNLWKMSSVLIRRADRGQEREGDPGHYFQVLYQNDNAAMLEMWHVWLREEEGRWLIARKEVTGNITALYKIRIPSGRAEFASRVEVRHQDIRLEFTNAWVFYDNIPDLETALVVIGQGRLTFSPSSEIERHQLELRYKKPELVDGLSAVFLRFSDSFFKSNVAITPAPAGTTAPPVPVARASALFAKWYPASFTIENSLTGGLMSFAPRGQQVVFELVGRKTGSTTYIFSPFSDDQISFVRNDPEQILNLYTPAASSEGGKQFFISFGEKFDIQRYDLDVNFQPEKYYLSARARVTVAARYDDLDNLEFNFHPRLDILRITDQDGRELFYTQDKLRKLLYIYFLNRVERGRTTTVEIFYRGELEPQVEQTDVIQFNPGLEPITLVPPRYDTLLYGQSVAWYPAPSDADYFQARIRVSVPPGYRCVANGALTEEGTIDAIRGVFSLDKVGDAYFTYEATKPVKYLSFVVGRLVSMSKPTTAPAFPLEGYSSAEMHGQRQNLLNEAQAILDRFEEWFGPYPYEKMTVILRPWPVAGGHSPASFVILNELPRSPDTPLKVISTSPVEFSSYREYYLAHEIAHQWWGQAVNKAGYRDQWMSEGLAQFAAVEYLRSKLGERVYAGILKRFAQWTEKKSVFGPITLGGRLSYLDFEAYQAIVYDKSALVLALLRDWIGEDAFLKGLREFFKAYTYKEARTSQFIRSMETASGRDLASFFQGWFDSHLLPDVRVAHEVEKLEDGFRLKFRVTQSRGMFVFPLWVTWLENGTAVRRKLDVDRATQEFEFRAAVRPSRIKINPDKFVPGVFK
jgi:hypothetical protein